MDTTKEKALKLAQASIFDYVLPAGEWNDYLVYYPIFWDDDVHYIGKPHSILIDDKEARWTTDEECFEVLDAMEEYKDERELENIPVELEPDVTIKSFKFERGGYFGNYQVFEYKSLKKGKFLSYREEGDDELSLLPAKVKILDEKFEENTLGIIKYFNEEFGTNPNILDGEWYEFKATLSNGQKLKSHGYNYFPYTYYKLIAYLEYTLENVDNLIQIFPLLPVEYNDYKRSRK